MFMKLINKEEIILINTRLSRKSFIHFPFTMAPTLYMMPPSPPVRAVLMTAKSIGLDLELKELNLRKGDNKTPEYLKVRYFFVFFYY